MQEVTTTNAMQPTKHPNLHLAFELDSTCSLPNKICAWSGSRRPSNQTWMVACMQPGSRKPSFLVRARLPSSRQPNTPVASQWRPRCAHIRVVRLLIVDNKKKLCVFRDTCRVLCTCCSYVRNRMWLCEQLM